MSELLASLDGAVMPVSEVLIPATDEGLLRGDGAFEVIRIYDGRPFALADHLARMERSAAGLRLPVDISALRAEIDALLAAAGPADAVLRVVVTRGGRRIAMVEALKDMPETLALACVTYAPTRVLDGIKSLSYGANMLCGRLAKERGFDEALLVTPHGRVLEAPTSSFFYSLDGETLVTPPLDDHILDSITRRRVMAATGAGERVTAADDLVHVREAFLASTLREVHPVRAIESHELDGAPGPLTRDAARLVRERIEAELLEAGAAA
jgi:branched-chain amino acid aminotransferase